MKVIFKCIKIYSFQVYSCMNFPTNIIKMLNISITLQIFFMFFSSHWWTVFSQSCVPFSVLAIPVCLSYRVLLYNSCSFPQVELLWLIFGTHLTVIGVVCVKVLGRLCDLRKKVLSVFLFLLFMVGSQNVPCELYTQLL